MNFIKDCHGKKFNYHSINMDEIKCIKYIYPIKSSIHSRMTEISDLFMVFSSKNLSFGIAEGKKLHFWTCAYSFLKENRTTSVLYKN